MTSDSDSLEVVARARGEDQSARHLLLGRFRVPLLSRIRLMMGEQVREVAESQDFLQQVVVDFLAASASLDLRGERDIFRWLTAVARNNIRDAARRKRAKAFEDLSNSFDELRDHREESLLEGLVAHERHVRLVEALERLRSDQREVIRLVDFEGLSLEEAAQSLGRSYEATKKLRQRALLDVAVLIPD